MKSKCVHQLLRPFERSNTKAWQQRQEIRTALENIKANADEAGLCLQAREDIQDHLGQASKAIQELQMNTHGLFARIAKGNSGGHHDWVSRDYEDLTCHATGCMFNREKKCMVPSRCKISPDGKCEGFKVPPAKRGLDGD